MEEKGTLIGRGRTADILAWDEGWVIKLVHSDYPASFVELECQITGLVQEHGGSAPAVGGMMSYQGRKGIVFERINGDSMLKESLRHPWRLRTYAHILARQHVSLHQICLPELPSQRKRLMEDLGKSSKFSTEIRNHLLKLLETLPDGNAVCHGDFHPDNVIMTQHGPVIIDWLTGTSGNPLADVARTVLLLSTPALPPDTTWITRQVIGVTRKIFLNHYLRQYQRLNPFDRKKLDEWMPVMVAVRLMEQNGPVENQWLLDFLTNWQRNSDYSG